jgi:hypothetical protein
MEMEKGKDDDLSKNRRRVRAREIPGSRPAEECVFQLGSRRAAFWKAAAQCAQSEAKSMPRHERVIAISGASFARAYKIFVCAKQYCH